MKLTVVNSNSLGNSYVLTSSDGQQLCIEAGRPLKEVRTFARLHTADCVGVIVSHSHGDHCRYIKDFLRAGIPAYSTHDVASTALGVVPINSGETYHLGDFSVAPIPVVHDVPCLSFLIHHPEMGSLYFFTDAFTMDNVIRGCSAYMCECNYDDRLLDSAVLSGKTPRSQADRIRLSHMSLSHAISFMRQCQADKTARRIILIHGSERHLNKQDAIDEFQQALGVATFFAEKSVTFNLS